MFMFHTSSFPSASRVFHRVCVQHESSGLVCARCWKRFRGMAAARFVTRICIIFHAINLNQRWNIITQVTVIASDFIIFTWKMWHQKSPSRDTQVDANQGISAESSIIFVLNIFIVRRDVRINHRKDTAHAKKIN
jgi:hypothetical protein